MTAIRVTTTGQPCDVWSRTAAEPLDAEITTRLRGQFQHAPESAASTTSSPTAGTVSR